MDIVFNCHGEKRRKHNAVLNLLLGIVIDDMYISINKHKYP